MQKYNIIFLIFLLITMIAAGSLTLSYPAGARFFPLIVIGICIFLLIGELAKEFIAARKFTPDVGLNGETQHVQSTEETLVKFLITVAWIAGLALMIWLFGYVVALPLYTFIYIRMHGQKLRLAISLSIAMLLIVYIGFNYLLKIPLYEGLMFQP